MQSMGIHPCNFCTMRHIRKDAEQRGVKVSVVPHPLANYFPNGVDVFVDGEWRCWFAELGDSCEC